MPHVTAVVLWIFLFLFFVLIWGWVAVTRSKFRALQRRRSWPSGRWLAFVVRSDFEVGRSCSFAVGRNLEAGLASPSDLRGEEEVVGKNCDQPGPALSLFCFEGDLV